VIFAIILVAIGLLRKQPRRYWIHAACAIGFQFIMGYLFNDQSGLLTPTLRMATGDGPAMALIAIVLVVILWAVPIAIVQRGYKRTPSPPSVPPPSI